MNAGEARKLSQAALSGDVELAKPYVQGAIEAVKRASMDGAYRATYTFEFRRDVTSRRQKAVIAAVVSHLSSQQMGYQVSLDRHPSDPRDGTGGEEFVIIRWDKTESEQYDRRDCPISGR